MMSCVLPHSHSATKEAKWVSFGPPFRQVNERVKELQVLLSLSYFTLSSDRNHSHNGQLQPTAFTDNWTESNGLVWFTVKGLQPERRERWRAGGQDCSERICCLKCCRSVSADMKISLPTRQLEVFPWRAQFWLNIALSWLKNTTLRGIATCFFCLKRTLTLMCLPEM